MYTTVIKIKQKNLAKNNYICKSTVTVDHNLNMMKCKPEHLYKLFRNIFGMQ